jgi:hypothetical protein
LLAGLKTEVSNTYVRATARKIDMTPYPPTIGALTRSVSLRASVDKTPGATSGTVQLIDNTHGGVLIAGTNMVTTSNANEEKDSGPLTVGSGAGNIRSDVASEYELQVLVTGGVPATDAVNITNARLVIAYA